MLKYRLIFGTLMAVVFIAVVIFDAWFDGSLTASIDDDKPIGATILCALVVLLIIPAQLELSKLAAVKNLKILMPVSIIATILFATTWYCSQFGVIDKSLYIVFLLAFSILGLFVNQYFRFGTSGTLANCGISYFAIIYSGLLSSFFLAVRLDFGLWQLLMFIFVVKSTDIGAYTFGKLFGKHKFSPGISPGKTWEGMAGGVFVAIIIAVLFALKFDIMDWPIAVVFGVCFAFVGQLGDLAESMIKRDAERKDSAENVPGFGGILDVIDSPLVAAPLAYLFFICSS